MSRKHIVVTARVSTDHEVKSVNQVLKTLGTKCEYPEGVALRKDEVKAREKAEEQYLKGVFTESLMLVERLKKEEEERLAKAAKRKSQDEEDSQMEDDSAPIVHAKKRAQIQDEDMED